MRILFFIAATSLSTPCVAEIFKSVDEEGNTVYSDTPDNRAEEFVPPSMNAIPMPKLEPKPQEAQQPGRAYNSLTITSPTSNQVVRNNAGILTITLKPTPELKPGHTYSVSIDGHVVVKKSNKSSISIPDINRGEHTIRAMIKNQKGKSLIRSNTVIIHMKRQSTQSGINKDIGPFDSNGKPIRPGPQTSLFKPGPAIPTQTPQ